MSGRFAEAVNYLIANHRLRNQAELVGLLGLSKGYVSQIVTGKREPSEQIVRRFANAFPEINISWLLTGDGEMTEKFDGYQKMLDTINALVEQNGKLLDIIDRLTQK